MKKSIVVLIILSLFIVTGCNSSKKSKIKEIDCSDCVYFYSKEPKKVGDEIVDYTKDYSSLNSNFFLGYKIDSNSKIKNTYICGIEKGKLFCIEGNIDDSKYEDNKKTLSKIYDKDSCKETILDGGKSYQCSGDIYIVLTDGASNYIGASKSDQCYVNYDSYSYCYFSETKSD